ncbi:hypothetical protein DK37_25950 [Halomonas sp. SUBG004]|nr:hypothetical protein DK37_25950 [Halomonas sp. SUBG004]
MSTLPPINCTPKPPPSPAGTPTPAGDRASTPSSPAFKRRERRRQRQARVGQRPNQHQVEDHVRNHGDNAYLDWRFGVLASKEARGEHLDQHKGH